MLFLIYMLGCIVAVITARLLRRFMFGPDETPFVMELPPYRVPTLNATMRHMWERSEQYLKKMGGLILIATVIIWFLSYYPRGGADATAQMPQTTVTENVAAMPDTATEASTQSEQSYLGRIGKFCEPAMQPLGLDWRASVAMLSGAAAKEIVVSTLGVLYPEPEAEAAESLPAATIPKAETPSRLSAFSMPRMTRARTHRHSHSDFSPRATTVAPQHLQ